MIASGRVRGILIGLVLALVGLTGCVQVPVAGPIERVEGQSETCQNCINVEVAPPAAGDGPGQIVEGFLQANANYQPNYSTARQFLTTTADQAWRPEAGVWIYTGLPGGKDDQVRLDGRLVGQIGADRTYTARNQKLVWDFQLVQENGQWRIDRPPPGLMVEEYLFGRFYSGYSNYFIGNGSSLVPERIYLPALRSPSTVASALINGLLDGPSQWLGPAVVSAIPKETSPSVAPVTITNGIAEVPLNEVVLGLPDEARSQLAAQIVYTLKQVPAIKGVVISVDGQPLRVPDADPGSLVIAMDAFSREMEPIPYVSDQLYAVKNGLVYRVTTPDGTAGLQPIAGPLGKKNRFDADSLAVSVNGTDVAVVTNGRTTLRRASTTTGDPTELKAGATDLLRPQFTRYGEVWALGRQGGQQRLWQFSPDRAPAVDAPVLGDGTITAFRISPDGARMALVRETARGSELGLALIVRGDKSVTVDGWRPIDITQSGEAPLQRIADLAWLDANDLLLVGAEDDGAPRVARRVSADASRITAEGGEPATWEARQLTVLSRPQTAVVVGRQDQTWRDTGSGWRPFLPGLTAVAYPG